MSWKDWSFEMVAIAGGLVIGLTWNIGEEDSRQPVEAVQSGFYFMDSERREFYAQDCNGDGSIDVVRRNEEGSLKFQESSRGTVGYVREGFDARQCAGPGFAVSYELPDEMIEVVEGIRDKQAMFEDWRDYLHVREGSKCLR